MMFGSEMFESSRDKWVNSYVPSTSVSRLELNDAPIWGDFGTPVILWARLPMDSQHRKKGLADGLSEFILLRAHWPIYARNRARC